VAAPTAEADKPGRSNARPRRDPRASRPRRRGAGDRARVEPPRRNGEAAGDAAGGRDRSRSAGGRDRADPVRRRRRRGLPRVLRLLSRRSAARPGDPPPPVGAPAPPCVAMGGARVGGHQAANRVPARGRDPAADRVDVGARARRAAGRAERGHDGRRRAGGARVHGPGAVSRSLADQGREGRGSRTLRRATGRRRAPVARDPGDRDVDGPLPRAVRARRPGRAALGRPRIPEADRAPREPGTPRRARGSRGVLAPYEPYRGLAGTFALAEYHRLVKKGRPLRRAA
jgi:hypothetical protein